MTIARYWYDFTCRKIKSVETGETVWLTLIESRIFDLEIHG